MHVSTIGPARRLILAVGLLAGVSLGGSAAFANATANKAVVQGFIATWPGDPQKAAPYLAPDAKLRLEEDKPAVIGPNGYISAIKPFESGGSSFSAQILATFAKGPVVVTSRIDTVKTPGKPDQQVKVVGVFVVKHGKIEEWTDYVYQ